MVVKKIKADGTGDYVSLNVWESFRRGDITAAGRNTIEVAEVYGGGSVGSVTLNVASWTVDSEHYVIIRAASGHENRMPCDTANKAYVLGQIWSNMSYTVVQDILIESNTNTAWKSGLFFGDGTLQTYPQTGSIAERCVIRRISGTDAQTLVGTCGGGSSGTATLRNCVVIDNGSGAAGAAVIASFRGSVLSLENCTIWVGPNRTGATQTIIGRYSGTGSISSQNCYIGTSKAYTIYGTAANGGDHDATSDASASDVDLRNIAYSTANFTSVTENAEDLHLCSGSALIQQGTTIEGVTDDFDADSRSDPPDIGADEYTAPPTTSCSTSASTSASTSRSTSASTPISTSCSTCASTSCSTSASSSVSSSASTSATLTPTLPPRMVELGFCQIGIQLSIISPFE